MEQKPLTIEELKEMAGQPVWCPDEEAYGVIMCDSIGRWAGIPFLHGVWYEDGNNNCGVEFNHNIIKRKLKCYRVKTSLNRSSRKRIHSEILRWYARTAKAQPL